MKRTCLLVLSLICIIGISCNHYKKPGLEFGKVKQIKFTEVRRVFNTGLVFNKQGYQLEPLWQLYFTSDDSAMVFSPTLKKYYGFRVYFDHDSIFNTIDTWLELKKLTPDSLVFRSLHVENKVILMDHEGSNVYMTFYSDQYIKRKGAEAIKRMGQPTAKDTAYIQTRSKLANQVIDSAFSARQPAILKSKSPYVDVGEVKTVPTLMNPVVDPAEDYLFPEYDIKIHHAYEDFAYSFSAFVDEKGKISFRKSTIPYSQEFQKSYERTIKAIIAGYLERYVNVTPGSTLGIPHASTILLNVTGKKE